MTDVSRRQRVAAGLAWVLVVAVALAGIAGNVLGWRYLATGDAISSAGAVPAAILYATLGALIVRRAGNVVGWFLLSGGMASAVVSLASAYAVIGTKNPGTLPAPPWPACWPSGQPGRDGREVHRALVLGRPARRTARLSSIAPLPPASG